MSKLVTACLEALSLLVSVGFFVGGAWIGLTLFKGLDGVTQMSSLIGAMIIGIAFWSCRTELRK